MGFEPILQWLKVTYFTIKLSSLFMKNGNINLITSLIIAIHIFLNNSTAYIIVHQKE